MLSALPFALTRLFDRKVLWIWLKSVLVTLLVFAVVGVASWKLIAELINRNADQLGLDPALTMTLAIFLAILVAWMLWRIIALGVLQFFADDVVHVVEQRDYPEMAAQARKLGWREEAGRALAGAGRTLFYNAMALPLVLILAATGIGAPLVFLLVNSVLLGRELQDMVWLRHRKSLADPAPLSRLERISLGGVTALLLTVPVANLAAPFLGAACAVHLIHRKGRA